MAYNFAKRLKSLKGKTPWQFILDDWEKHPGYFNSNPNQFLLGLNNLNFTLTLLIKHSYSGTSCHA
jgi:hypothetical protein